MRGNGDGNGTVVHDIGVGRSRVIHHDREVFDNNVTPHRVKGVLVL